ncbi:MAG: DUF2318 domain-containing protein [Deltaproteobacteria bacterium]|nr:DUF2318 domain-containing protein [Deltaproteobacteria bacterium]
MYFLKVLEAFPFALALALIGAVLTGLREFDRGGSTRRLVFWGLALGLLTALVLAALKFRALFPAGHPLHFLSRIVVNREFYNLALLWPMLATMVAFTILCPAPRKRVSVSSRSCFYLGAALVTLWAAFGPPDLFIYPFDFGVGLDSVFNLDYLARVTGYCLGFVLLIVLALAVYFQILTTPPKLMKYFLKASLIVLIGFILLKTTQIMLVRGLLPRSRGLNRAVIFVLERDNFFLYAQLVIWGGLAFWRMVSSRLVKPLGANPALVRKAKADLARQFRIGLLVILSFAAFLASVTALKAYSERGPNIAEPLTVEAKDGLIKLEIAVIGDGQLHRRQFLTKSGVMTRFIVIKKNERAYGVGLDACDICGATGYYQRGDQVICKLCDVVMNKVTIGFPGGCNPVPLDFRIEAGFLVIEAANLEKEQRRFQ